MASISKLGDNWRAQVNIKGERRSATFDTKAEASAWAAKTETELRDLARGKIPDKRVLDLLEEYEVKVLPGKRGYDKELVRLKMFKTDALAKVHLRDLDETAIAAWRDRRAKAVSDATVNREWNLWSHVFTTAKKEWKWIHRHPMVEVSRPKTTPPRDRKPTQDEIETLLYILGYDELAPLATITNRVGAAVVWAVETAMRQGEICALRWDDIDLEKRVAVVRGEDARAGKSGKRLVPLSSRAMAVLEKLAERHDGEVEAEDKVFDLRPEQVDAAFRKARDKAGIEDLHFHDLRSEALTRLAKKVEPMILAKISGHKDLKILLNTYYRIGMDDVAKLLD